MSVELSVQILFTKQKLFLVICIGHISKIETKNRVSQVIYDHNPTSQFDLTYFLIYKWHSQTIRHFDAFNMKSTIIEERSRSQHLVVMTIFDMALYFQPGFFFMNSSF